jgi:hypothetical protein
VPLLGVCDKIGCASSGGARVQVRRGRERDSACQAPAAPDRGTILTQAWARRECALAYRATVDAVYAEAELDAGARRPGDNQTAEYTAARRADIAANGTGPGKPGQPLRRHDRRDDALHGVLLD